MNYWANLGVFEAFNLIKLTPSENNPACNETKFGLKELQALQISNENIRMIGWPEDYIFNYISRNLKDDS